MSCYIVRNDLINMRVDAVVCPANSALKIGGGAGEAIARVAGVERLQHACDAIGFCAVGSAVATPAFGFPARLLIHAVGPVWQGGAHNESALLASCVTGALELAAEAGVETVALPLISSGSFGFPRRLAFDITMRAIKDFLKSYDLCVYLVLFDRESVLAGNELLGSVAEYIDDAYVEEHFFEGTCLSPERPLWGLPDGTALADGALPPDDMTLADFAIARSLSDTEFNVCDDAKVDACLQAASPDVPFDARIEPEALSSGARQPFAANSFSASELQERVACLDESFAAAVLRLIDERGFTDVQVYKRANMSRQLFAKIRKDDGYRPTKRTACALAIALELSYAEACDLLGRAEFALSHSSKFDVIVEYFLISGIYDIFKVNEALYAFDQPLLG